jgi:hypothetical protein
MNFSDRLRRLGTLVKVEFPLETVPKKSVKTFSHQAAYNSDVTFFRFISVTCPYKIRLGFSDFFTVLFFSVFL